MRKLKFVAKVKKIREFQCGSVHIHHYRAYEHENYPKHFFIEETVVYGLSDECRKNWYKIYKTEWNFYTSKKKPKFLTGYSTLKGIIDSCYDREVN